MLRWSISLNTSENIEQNSLKWYTGAVGWFFNHKGEYDLIIEQTFSALYHR
jgi:hypothetical protein